MDLGETLGGKDHSSLSRLYFFNLIDNATSDDALADILTLIGTLDGEALESALPTLCILAEKCQKSAHGQIINIVYSILSDSKSTRGARKAGYACLKVIFNDENSLWNNFFILLESLEEPQFHIIRPILPRIDGLLHAVDSNLFNWKWVALIFSRSLMHSNGWIRLWALEKAITTDAAKLSLNYDFITLTLIPSLNSNDLYWRLLEGNRLESFIKSFGALLDNILLCIYGQQRETFLRSFLMALEGLSCPLSFYFISQSLLHISAHSSLNHSDFALFRTVLKKVQYMPHESLKMVTLCNLCLFFAKILTWTTQTISDFGTLTTCFSRDSPKLFESFVFKLGDIWRSNLTDNISPFDMIQLILEDSRNVYTSDFPRLLWLHAQLSDKEAHFNSQLSLSLADRLTSSEEVNIYDDNTAAIDRLLAVWCSMPNKIGFSNDGLQQLIIGHILLQIAVASGTPLEVTIVKDVYLPILARLSYLKAIPDIVFPLMCEKVITCERHSLLSTVLLYALNHDSQSNHFCVISGIKDYLGSNMLFSPLMKKSIESITGKEFIRITTNLRANKMDLMLRHFSALTVQPRKMLIDCIEQLSCVTAYPIIERLLRTVEYLIDDVTETDVLLSVINAAGAVVNEERKSQHYLPALKILFTIAFKKPVLENEMTSQKVKIFFCEFLTTAALNVSIALTIANALNQSQHFLNCDWTEQVMRIAVFGPIPKKEHKVLNSAYEMAYEGEYKDILPQGDMERLHEVVQVARVRGLNIALRKCQESEKFAEKLVTEILSESLILDKSSSKSFGLSLAHRHKSRLVALLLFVVEYVKNEEILSDVFWHCVECITDPCQQFSIKIILEWILVRLSLRNPTFKEQMISLEKELAQKRIGSISSWINMLVLLSRVENDEASFARFISLVIPWTTAQNFSVRCTAIAAAKLMYNGISMEKKTRWDLVRRIVEFDSEPAGNSRRIIENLTSDFYFSCLHVVEHFNLQTAFVEIPLKTGMPEEETIPVILLKSINISSVRCLNEDLSFLVAPSVVYSSLSKNNKSMPDFEVSDTDEELQKGSILSTITSFQRKMVTKERKKKTDCSMIVVASLVNKPANLGGLCRTSEIFGVDSLVVSNLNITTDSNFSALSMSSENWQKIETVRPDMLPLYLNNLRMQGYTVIAAEQTTDSVPMHTFVFPKKSVLLVGDEKEGIPVQLLRCVDRTVEIKQLGQTRSLNVHVTAALFIAKYAEQILLQ